jgi:hypothetical protein
LLFVVVLSLEQKAKLSLGRRTARRHHRFMLFSNQQPGFCVMHLGPDEIWCTSSSNRQ